jgi:hypothetical protein
MYRHLLVAVEHATSQNYGDNQLRALVVTMRGANSARLDMCTSSFVECGHRPNCPLHNPVCDISISQVFGIVDIGNCFLPKIFRCFLPRPSVLNVELFHRKPMFPSHRDVVCVALRAHASKSRGMIRSCSNETIASWVVRAINKTAVEPWLCKNAPEKDRPL